MKIYILYTNASKILNIINKNSRIITYSNAIHEQLFGGKLEIMKTRARHSLRQDISDRNIFYIIMQFVDVLPAVYRRVKTSIEICVLCAMLKKHGVLHFL
jgi:hypothetical protein